MFLLLILHLTAVSVPSASSQALCADKNGTLEDYCIAANILNIINNGRKKLAKGRVVDGADPPNEFPKGTAINKLGWSCDLEKTASEKLGNDCKHVPDLWAYSETGTTGFFYDDPDNEEHPMSVVVSNWLQQVKDGEWTKAYLLDPEVKMPPDYYAREFANLMRANTTKIGCAELSCSDDNKTFVFCLTDNDPLRDNDEIYVKGEPCTDDSNCNATETNTKCDVTMGLCEEPVEATTTAMTTNEITTAVTTVAAETTMAASYPGELPTGTNTLCKEYDGMTDELRMHFLDTQNYRRSTLAKGEVQRPSENYLPTGANIMKLKLNCTLEKEAIQEVRQCPTSKTPHGKYGKNFDTFPSSTVTSTYKDAIKKAVTNWWKVVRTEGNGPGMQVTFRDDHVNQPVETYTQIAWAETTDLGCAIAKCSSSYTVICLYYPKGNIVNQTLYKIGSPCAACPSDTTCDSGLKLCVQK